MKKISLKLTFPLIVLVFLLTGCNGEVEEQPLIFNDSSISDVDTCIGPECSEPDEIGTSQCTGEAPKKAVLCSDDNNNLSASISNLLVNRCSNRKCEYVCSNGYFPSKGSCYPKSSTPLPPVVPPVVVPPPVIPPNNIVYTCSGTAPTNSTMCTNDGVGLLKETEVSVVSSCNSNKCEYTCNPGYEYDSVDDLNLNPCVKIPVVANKLPKNTRACYNESELRPGDDTYLYSSCNGTYEENKRRYVCEEGYVRWNNSCERNSNLKFVSEWITTAKGETITLPLRKFNLDETYLFEYDFEVDWGDGSTSQVTSFDDEDKVHEYETPGTHIIRISGLAEAWSFAGEGDRNKILRVFSFGNLGWIDLRGAFEGCTMLSMFKGGITNNVTDMSRMFHLSGRGDDYRVISSLHSVDLSTFSTAKVTTMESMFDNAKNISQIDLGNFNTSNVKNMKRMFAATTNLVDLNVSSFDTSAVTDFYMMFYASRNIVTLNLDNFDTSSGRDMQFMFGDTNKLENLNISSFNTSSVTKMGAMFVRSNLEDYDFSNWNFKNVESFTFASNRVFNKISAESYSSFLIKLEATSTKSNLVIPAQSNAKYLPNAINARNNLINRGWTIEDGGLSP